MAIDITQTIIGKLLGERSVWTSPPFVLTQEFDADALPDVTAVRLSLYSTHSTKPIVNDLEHHDLLTDAERWLVADDPVTIGGEVFTAVRLRLLPDDMAILDASRAHETRAALVRWYWGTGLEAWHRFIFTIKNEAKIPEAAP